MVVPSGVLPPLLVLLLWEVGEPPGPHWRAGPGVEVLDSGPDRGVVVLDFRLAEGMVILDHKQLGQIASLILGWLIEWSSLLLCWVRDWKIGFCPDV